MTADHSDDMQRAHVSDVPTDGSLVGNRYRLGDVLGQGGFGVVYAAADELLRRRVAVKEVRFPPGTTDADREILVERVMREARSAARLHHPGVVAVLDVIDDGGRPWIVMELVDSRSLSTVISEDGPLSPAAAAKIGVSVAYALEAAHRAGVIHRDVKPGNVLITPDSGARLTDFGIALTADDPKLTKTGMLVGSPAYIAPERARGGAGGAASDVWGLGATLYAAVEGAPPFESHNAIATLTAVVEGRRRPFQLAGPLAPLIDELMAVDESTRPALSTARRRLREISDPDLSRRSLSSRRVPRTRPSPPPPAPAPNSSHEAATTLVVPNTSRGRGAKAGGASPAAQPSGGTRASLASAFRRRPGDPRGAAAAAAAAHVAENGTATPEPAAAPAPAVPLAEAAPPDQVTQVVMTQVAVTQTADPGFAAASEQEPAAAATAAAAAEPIPAATTPVAATRVPSSSPRARASLASAFRRHPGDPRGAPATITPSPEPPSLEPPSPEPTSPVPAAAPAASRQPEATAGSPSAPDRTDRPRLRLAVVAAGLVAVVAALGGAVVISADDTDTQITGTETAAAASANPAPTAALPVTVATDPGLVSSDSSPAPAPPGWVTYRDPTGWSISHPADWIPRPKSNPGNVDFENPRSGALLRIGTVDVANPSALADWLAHEQSFLASEEDYRRIRLEPSDGATGAEQADWEFTYTLRGETVHVLDRGVIRNGHGYALYWRTTQQRWSDDEPLMWRLFATFRPGL